MPCAVVAKGISMTTDQPPSEAPKANEAEGVLCSYFGRRQLLAAGAASALALITGCGRRERTDAYQQPSTAGQAPRVIAATGPVGFRYTVRRGDTLSSIARVSGLSVQTIMTANNLRSTLIRPGDILALPGVDHLEPDPQAAKPSVAMTPNTVPGTYRFQARHTWTRQAVRSNHNKMNGVRKITIHHTGEHAGLAGLSDREIIRRVENYHRNERKWAAIGYHFIIGKDGTVYEGRPATIQGAHVSGNNRHNLGISIMGDFQSKLPTSAQLQSLTALTSQQRRRYRVSPGNIYGHRDLGQSVCPGDRLYAWMQSNKSALVG